MFLNRARITINGKITNAAILLLGKPESEHFISPAQARITWILKDRDGVEKDYEHFSCPIILSAQQVFQKIRNNKYRYMQEGSLFPEEVLQYDPYSIREALNNCIAHQDYTMGGKINVVESEDGFLTFKNAGDFIPGSIENVIKSDAPESVYRNPFLVAAMVNLNMIDSVGSGIKRLFDIQRNRYFPLPEFDLTRHSVTLTILGKILDMNYARKLASNKDISLEEIIHLDLSQKKKKTKATPHENHSSFDQTFAQTFGQTFDQKIRPHFKQQSSYQKAKNACAALYNLISKDVAITKQIMQNETGIKATTLKTYLKYLTEANLIKRVGPDNGGHWEVISENSK